MSRTVRAEEAGAQVWKFVNEILTNPYRLTQGLERMLEHQTSPAGADEASWLKGIAEINVKQERLLDLHLDGDVTTEQFRTRALS